MTKKNKGSYGKNVCVAISLPASVVQEVEKRRRFDSRSRYILRAVDKYLREEEEQESKGVRGSGFQPSAPATPATPEAVAVPQKTNSLINKRRSSG